MDDNLGYNHNIVGRTAMVPNAAFGAYQQVKFRIASSGLLQQNRLLPVFAMPISI